MSDVITLSNVSITHPGASTPTLRNINLTVAEGDLTLVVGRTGTGKSTLLGTLNGIVPHFSGGRLDGTVTVAGRDTRTHRPRELADVVGVVGQNPVAGFVTDTVEDEIAYGMEQLGISPFWLPSLASLSSTNRPAPSIPRQPRTFLPLLPRWSMTSA